MDPLFSLTYLSCKLRPLSPRLRPKMEPHQSELSILPAQGDYRSASHEEPESVFHENPNPEIEFSLPPVDGGKDAWLFLVAAFIIEVLVWGICFPSRSTRS